MESSQLMGPGFRQISVGSGPNPSLLISGPNFLPFIQSPFPGRKNYFKNLYFSFSLCLFLSPFLCLFYTHTHTHTHILSCFTPHLCGLQWHPTPVLLPRKSHGWRSLVGCSPWGCEELDTTEQLHFHFSLSCIGEGNGNPVQCSCLENPRHRGAWWAAVYAVTQSRTRLKWLSSRSSIHIVAIDKISSCVIAE